jgi:MFS family permease
MLFPASVAIVVAAFPQRERGRAMAIFFGIAGGLTAIGPIAGGFLTQWTWRSIFWINIPVAIVALRLIRAFSPDNERRPAKLDYRGTVMLTGAMGVIVLGLEHSSVWGWSSVATWFCIVVGLVLMVAFVARELRAKEPLPALRIFLDRAFAADTAVLGLGPASTDAVNRAPSTSYSEVTGITQTARNFGASLGLAVLGAILVSLSSLCSGFPEGERASPTSRIPCAPRRRSCTTTPRKPDRVQGAACPS